MKQNSKEAIVTAAISLFNRKGFSGTTIRDIAQKANSNIANISYYFQNKHGLLEYCFTTYFESYLKEIEKGYSYLNEGETVCLKKIVENILIYQCNHIQLTRLILREMSIDSQVVREIMSTYYIKERYYFKKVFESGVKSNEFKAISIHFIIIQLKGLLSMPFLNSAYISEVLHVFPHEQYFMDKYRQEIFSWIDGVVCNSTTQKALLVT